MFTSWYGQASCTAGRASFMTGRIPIRTALSVVVVPGDPNGLDADTPTIAEFYQKNGYQTYFSGKWHLGDVPKFYPIEHGFDEMKQFAAYYPGVYAYSDTASQCPSVVPLTTTRSSRTCIRRREHVRMGRLGGQAGGQGKRRRDYAGEPCRFRCPADGFGGRLHQAARQGRQAVLHERELHDHAPADQPEPGVPGQIAPWPTTPIQ